MGGMAVGTRQAAEEYERAADYVRRLCEGEDVEGLPSLRETGDNGSSAGRSPGQPTPQADGVVGQLVQAPTHTSPQATRGSSQSVRASSQAVRTPTRAARQNGTRTLGAEAHDVCDACGQAGQFICCERCPRVYHFLCVEPPMTKEMVSQIDHWYCRVCSHQRSKKRKSRAHAKNIFYPLISAVEYANPRTFSVPEDIRRLFDGVEADVDGTYVNVREERAQRVHMGLANRDFTRLTDDHNEPIMCYRCGVSALHGPLVRCDYCPLGWHWDCLAPPLSSAPPPHRRWMCPNHAEHAMRRHHKFRKERIVDQTNAASNARNSGIVDVVDDDPPWHEVCDPKVRYRITSSRIRDEFSSSARPASLCDPTPVADPYEPPLTVAEWLQSIVAFQQDVARFLASPSAEPNADKFSVLSSVAAQILGPGAVHAESNGVQKSEPDGVQTDDEQAALSALTELPQADELCSQTQMLEEYGLSVDDLESALDRIIACDSTDVLSDSMRNQSTRDHPRHTSKRLRTVPNDAVCEPDKMAMAARARGARASAMVTGLLKAKGSSALLSFLFND
ncbi:hypothetical protein GGH12_001465 [Coemansia sp. RSA 1822]|nr:hypothetical protein GGH12_001465 [Coemansia sp. RSA 1822]